jgi:hypothetical protein
VHLIPMHRRATARAAWSHSSREVAKLRVLDFGDKPKALSKIKKDPQRCQTSQLMV